MGFLDSESEALKMMMSTNHFKFEYVDPHVGDRQFRIFNRDVDVDIPNVEFRREVGAAQGDQTANDFLTHNDVCGATWATV